MKSGEALQGSPGASGATAKPSDAPFSVPILSDLKSSNSLNARGMFRAQAVDLPAHSTSGKLVRALLAVTAALQG